MGQRHSSASFLNLTYRLNLNRNHLEFQTHKTIRVSGSEVALFFFLRDSGSVAVSLGNIVAQKSDVCIAYVADFGLMAARRRLRLDYSRHA